MRHPAWLAAASLLAVVTAASDAAGQSIATRVNSVRDGIVQMQFAPRPGVCGDGNGSTWMENNRGERSGTFYGNGRYVCVAGPIRVTLGRTGGETISIRTCVACRPRSVSAGDADLGDVPATEAAKYLLDAARRSGGRNTDDAISAAALADAGDLSPEFMRLVQDQDASIEARKQGLFWFGQSEAPTSALVKVYDSLQPYSLKEHYTFVLSQRRDDDAALDKLIDIARHDSSFEVRKQAMFWLGQSHDPKAIKFFRDVLSP